MVHEWRWECGSGHAEAAVLHELGRKCIVLSGKWMVFAGSDQVDLVWRGIVHALAKRLLGPSAKVFPKPTRGNHENHVNQLVEITKTTSSASMLPIFSTEKMCAVSDRVSVHSFSSNRMWLRKLHYFNPQVCTVIDDSNMFITIFSRHKKPKADHLVDLYMRAQRSANVLPIREWRHHLRAHNTMADALANFAMDTKATITLWPSADQYMPSPFRLLLTKLQTFCASNLQPWLLSAADWRPP